MNVFFEFFIKGWKLESEITVCDINKIAYTVYYKYCVMTMYILQVYC